MLDKNDVKFFKLAVGSERIKTENNNEIVARCPVCGDSRKSQNKARLHLYSACNTAFVNCFNGDCPVHNKNMFSFLKEFYPNLYDKYLDNYKRQSLFTLLDDFKVDPILTDKTDKRNNSKGVKLVYQDFSEYFKPLETVKSALNYFENRGFKYDKSMKLYYSDIVLKIGDKEHNLKNSIVIPLYNENFEWYGFYSRNISEKKFCTYMNPENNSYKVWNFFNVDKEKPVYIFEGIFDALSAIQSGLTNCIACLGAQLPDERLKELKDPVFCLDNDRTGLKNMLNYAKQGYKVLIHSESEKDCNEMLKSGKNVKDIILNNIYEGVLAQVKIKSLL